MRFAVVLASFVLVATACSSSSKSSGDGGSGSSSGGSGGGACCILPDGTTLGAAECNPQATAVNLKPGEWGGEDTNGNASCTLDPSNPCYESLGETDGGLVPMPCPCHTLGGDGGRVDGQMRACH